jgi:hypothetical protein
VDFIYASRPAARRLLSNATAIQTAFGELRVVSTEGLIGLKLQGFVNNPRRTQDLEDIKALIAANRPALKMDELADGRDGAPPPAASIFAAVQITAQTDGCADAHTLDGYCARGSAARTPDGRLSTDATYR